MGSVSSLFQTHNPCVATTIVLGPLQRIKKGLQQLAGLWAKHLRGTACDTHPRWSTAPSKTKETQETPLQIQSLGKSQDPSPPRKTRDVLTLFPSQGFGYVLHKHPCFDESSENIMFEAGVRGVSLFAVSLEVERLRNPPLQCFNGKNRSAPPAEPPSGPVSRACRDVKMGDPSIRHKPKPFFRHLLVAVGQSGRTQKSGPFRVKAKCLLA